MLTHTSRDVMEVAWIIYYSSLTWIILLNQIVPIVIYYRPLYNYVIILCMQQIFYKHSEHNKDLKIMEYHWEKDYTKHGNKFHRDNLNGCGNELNND